MFNWPQFLTSHGVHYVTSGPNCGPGQCSVKCPWCREADPSEHLTINLRGAGWRCFRNPRAHVGRSRSRLIQALLSCSQEEARRLADEGLPPPPEDSGMVEALAGMLGVETPASVRTPLPPLTFPPEFKLLGPTALTNSVFARQFWVYLAERGYSLEDRGWLADKYQLYYAVNGACRYRLIIPIYGADDKLQTWTARSILPDETLRYKTFSKTNRYGPDEPVALEGPTNLLLGLPLLLRVPNPEVLVLCEGPFDAFRVTVLGRHKGVYGTCLFGLNISEAQVVLLERLMSRFRRLVLLLDPDADFLTLRIKEHLTPLVVKSGRLPEGIEDPGALPYEVGQKLVQSWL